MIEFLFSHQNFSMTTAENTAHFETSFLVDNSDDSHLIMSENITKSSGADIVSSPAPVIPMKQENNDICDSKHPEPTTTNEEISTESQNISNQDSNFETLPKTEEDEWLDIMGSGNFKKKVIKSGIDHESRPSRGDKVTVDISYFVNNQLIEEQKDLRFIVGDLDVIQGIDLAICLMEKGEQAKIMIPSKLAYGAVGLLPDVPPDSDIECDIELKEVEPVYEQLLSVPERLKLGDEKRSRGNFFYDRGQYIDAIHCYERSAEYLDGIRDCSDSSPEDLQEIVNMRLKVYNNMAASHLKMNAYSSALKSVEAVLKVQPKNVKALFRKGKILGLQGQIDEAINCLKMAANLEPETKIILVELAKLKYQKKREEHTQKLMYQRMFKSEPKKSSNAVSWIQKWSMISCGVLAVAIGSAVAYRQYHP